MSWRVFRPLWAVACAIALAGCWSDGQPAGVNAAQPRGASVAFDSIEGPPKPQFEKLVKNLNDEAQSRHLAVIARDQQAAYRVRGYLAAKVVNNAKRAKHAKRKSKRQTTVSWVWDVFDAKENRALRISGEETVAGGIGWKAADDAMLKRIAGSSMDRLATFLTAPAASPNAPAPAAPQIALIGQRDFSPEAAGIFRIFQTKPAPAPAAPAAEVAAQPLAKVPLPRRRPPVPAATSARETLDLAASRAAKR